MSESTRWAGHLRERPPPYIGARRGGYNGQSILDDLVDADGPGAARIIARYAAVRFWLVRRYPDRGVVRHAASAAGSYLGAVEAAQPDWAEGRLLRRLVDDPHSEHALALLMDAAGCAEAGGHPHGAAGIRRALGSPIEFPPTPG